MSGFIATGSSEPFVITNDWFPDINVDHLRAALRLDASVTDARIEAATVSAILSVNRELSGLKTANNSAETLADIDAPNINGETTLVALYRRAIYSTVGADLTERYRSYDSSGKGLDHSDMLTTSIDEYRRDARWAISDLLGISRNTVELI